jgi:hypothetical protein
MEEPESRFLIQIPMKSNQPLGEINRESDIPTIGIQERPDHGRPSHSAQRWFVDWGIPPWG